MDPTSTELPDPIVHDTDFHDVRAAGAPGADGATDPSALLALAARSEGHGRYNLAKLLRAAAAAVVQRRADERLSEAPEGDDLVNLLVAASDAWTADALLAPLAPSLRRAALRLGQDALPLMADAPDPRLCRRCGHLEADGRTPDTCPHCLADADTFFVQRPVWWLTAHDRESALAALARTPRRLRELLERVPRERWAKRPDARTWSPHEVLVHLRDAQGVLAQRVERLLEEDDPELDLAMVWTWTAAGRDDDTEALLAAYEGTRQQVLQRLLAVPLAGWARTGRHQEFGRLTLTEQVSYFAAHEPTHLRQVQVAVVRFGGPDRR
jgi:hypothetical protein